MFAASSMNLFPYTAHTLVNLPFGNVPSPFTRSSVLKTFCTLKVAKWILTRYGASIRWARTCCGGKLTATKRLVGGKKVCFLGSVTIKAKWPRKLFLLTASSKQINMCCSFGSPFHGCHQQQRVLISELERKTNQVFCFQPYLAFSYCYSQ